MHVFRICIIFGRFCGQLDRPIRRRGGPSLKDESSDTLQAQSWGSLRQLRTKNCPESVCFLVVTSDNLVPGEGFNTALLIGAESRLVKPCKGMLVPFCSLP